MELLLASLFLGTMVVAATSALGAASVSKNLRIEGPITAMSIAQEIHAATALLPRAPGLGTPATTGEEVEVLEDLDAAVFSPPLDAALQPMTELAGWRQEIGLQRVELADPDAISDDSSDEGVLYLLTVTIRQGAKVEGSYTWWIHS